MTSKFIIILLLLLSLGSMNAVATLPRTSGQSDDLLATFSSENNLPSLESFQAQLITGKPGELVGVWAEGQLAYRIESEPGMTVPHLFNTAGIYGWAYKRGVTALMIHDFLGGIQLYELQGNEAVALIRGDGQVDWYRIDRISRYEASEYSLTGFQGPFRPWDCQECSYELEVQDLQYKHYSGAPHLAFQTCLEQDGRVGLIILEASPVTD